MTFSADSRLVWTLGKVVGHGFRAAEYVSDGNVDKATAHARAAASWYRRYSILRTLRKP